MRRVRSYLLASAALTAAVVAVYRFGLSQEARDRMCAAARSVRDAYHKIEYVLSSGSVEYEHPEDLPNRRATEAQWEALGL